jgi:TonB family protein
MKYLRRFVRLGAKGLLSAVLCMILPEAAIHVLAGSDAQSETPCSKPSLIYSPDPPPPQSWAGQGPKSAETHLEINIDKKGKVHDPIVIKSGGSDVDKEAINAVRSWRFTPAKCGKNPIETKTNVVLRISLR